MFYFFVNVIFWTLALYGLLEIIKTIIYAFTYTCNKPDGIYLIIATKNQEKNIEGFLRSYLFKILYEKEDNIKDIIIADLGSNDKTKEIATKVTKELDSIQVTDWKECKDIIDNFDNLDNSNNNEGIIASKKI